MKQTAFLFLVISIFINLGLPSHLIGQNPQSLTLPSLFADHMVLQQDTTVTFWGTARSESNVAIDTEWGATASSRTDMNGKWEVQLETPKAGGPYSVTISEGAISRKLSDVYSGEVWLASGQSNMEMPLEGFPPQDTIRNSEHEIANADYPEIRMFTVERAMSDKPVKDVKGNWQTCTPDNAESFSATAYFFARKLHKTMDVPVGIIHSSWGGTPAESWVSNKKLRSVNEFTDVLDKIESSKPERRKAHEWMNRLEVINLDSIDSTNVWTGVDFNDRIASEPEYDVSDWKEMTLPQYIEEGITGSFDGIVWFRRTLNLDYSPQNQHILSLGPIDDMDAVYINGEKVGQTLKTGLYQKDRVYEVPSNVLKSGENVIAIQVIDPQGNGGLWGDASDLYLESSDGAQTNLAGSWKYLPTGEYRNGRMYLYDIRQQQYYDKPEVSMSMNQNTPSVLYNAMIAPLTDYTLKGSIWYQGESNVGRAEQYKKLFPALIRDWREAWGYEFPFYFVQIAPFTYNNDSQKPLSAALREAQLYTMQNVENTGMAITLDIGSAETIHPANKQDVGKRLALWSLGDTYGKDVTTSGPVPRKFSVNENEVVIEFNYVDGGLKLKESSSSLFELADKNGDFHPAKSRIKNGKLILSAKQVSEPTAVRYAWKDMVEGILFNKAGLPATSFYEDLK